MLFVLRKERRSVMTVDIEIRPDGFTVGNRVNVVTPSALPARLQDVKPKGLAPEFEQWWADRMIPKNAPDLEELAYEMGHIDHSVSVNAYGIIKNLTLVRYGRNATDKYWLAPVRDASLNTGKSSLDYINKMIIPGRNHDTYSHIDIFENWSDGDLAVVPKYLRICTNGEKEKRFVKESGLVWLEKPSVCIPEKILYEAQARYPFMAHMEPLYSDGEMTAGIRTKISTDRNTSFVSLRQFFYSSTGRLNISEDALLDAAYNCDFDTDVIEEMIEAAKRYFIKENDMRVSEVYDNAGWIVDSVSEEIVSPVMWI